MTQTAYIRIIEENLATLFSRDLAERSDAMGAQIESEELVFKAFGGRCRMARDGITLDDTPQDGPLGIILTLYALHAASDPIRMVPFKAFKEFPNSMPYVGAFASHTEQILVPSVAGIIGGREQVLKAMEGETAPKEVGGDSAMVVRPLPKIALCYIFYEADEDFPPSATCLYSNNADRFMPMDGLADVGEYTSKSILNIVA